MARRNRNPPRMGGFPYESDSQDEQSSETASDSESDEDIASEDDRDGKFPDISTFMDVPQGTRIEHKTPRRLPLEPGWIIHIRDREELAINDRILLVIQVLSQSVMCLSFCSHYPLRMRDHWQVVKGTRGTAVRQAGQTENPCALELRLRPNRDSPEEGLAPKDGITINLRDIWNIETSVSRTVYVAYLGRAKTGSLRRLSLQVQRTFCHYMNREIPQGSHPRTPKRRRRRERGGRDDERRRGYG